MHSVLTFPRSESFATGRRRARAHLAKWPSDTGMLAPRGATAPLGRNGGREGLPERPLSRKMGDVHTTSKPAFGWSTRVPSPNFPAPACLRCLKSRRISPPPELPYPRQPPAIILCPKGRRWALGKAIQTAAALLPFPLRPGAFQRARLRNGSPVPQAEAPTSGRGVATKSPLSALRRRPGLPLVPLPPLGWGGGGRKAAANTPLGG